MKLVKIMPIVCKAVLKVNSGYFEESEMLLIYYHIIQDVSFYSFDIFCSN